VTSVIIGIRRLEQLADNLAATTVDIPADDLTALDDLTAPRETYPG
jgi:aryl-alcohol dehydrogenase-like predicted oxidoreductase